MWRCGGRGSAWRERQERARERGMEGHEARPRLALRSVHSSSAQVGPERREKERERKRKEERRKERSVFLSLSALLHTLHVRRCRKGDRSECKGKAHVDHSERESARQTDKVRGGRKVTAGEQTTKNERKPL